jgi:hypothetical protein
VRFARVATDGAGDCFRHLSIVPSGRAGACREQNWCGAF